MNSLRIFILAYWLNIIALLFIAYGILWVIWRCFWIVFYLNRADQVAHYNVAIANAEVRTPISKWRKLQMWYAIFIKHKNWGDKI
jgi:hypothetical protein